MTSSDLPGEDAPDRLDEEESTFSLLAKCVSMAGLLILKIS